MELVVGEKGGVGCMVQAGEVHMVVFRLIKLVVCCSESLDSTRSSSNTTPSSEGITAVQCWVHVRRGIHAKPGM